MHDLKPLTPLGATEPRVDQIGPIKINEIVSVARATVAARHGAEQATRAALGQLLGVAVPTPSRYAGSEVSAISTGPDRWLIEAPIETHEDLARFLQGVLGANASITEQTDAWCRFDLQGDGLPSVMERLCAADTHQWQGGEAQRTVIDHLGCYAICRDASSFSVLGPRSAAGSLHHTLITTCQSVF
ncbi:sarcosine oxidase subunit gamma [uncultured Ruegeria sp.]|uniref:sarcosine oxidase subunit gamma n=1 Tax=uncultured Ruegeria sp. TaxID=259304 RepID=UPI00261AE5EE|nr:sarcosine oxidase subunit gamma [uncultured Ruegeria sp.]